MISIAVCISTRKRPDGLRGLLKSINEILLPADVFLYLVVVENDLDQYSAGIVNEFSKESRYPVSYHLEPNPGISFARNRSVKEAGNCDFCCFVDDDQVVDANWLNELLKCQREFNSDGVSGITPPLFEKEVAEYVRFFHNENSEPYGTILNQAATGCLLIRKNLLDKISGPFNLKLNFTGGEDFYLTYLISLNGGIIRKNPNAISYEIIPEERTTIRYIIRRTVRTANTKVIVKALINPKFSKWEVVPRMILRFLNGFLLLLPCLFFCKAEKLKGIFKISYSIGELGFILGRKTRFYKLSN